MVVVAGHVDRVDHVVVRVVDHVAVHVVHDVDHVHGVRDGYALRNGRA